MSKPPLNESLPPPTSLQERQKRLLQEVAAIALMNDGELPLPEVPRNPHLLDHLPALRD